VRTTRILFIVLAACAAAPVAAATGQELTYHQLPDGSQPAHVARGADGGIWFTMPGTGRIGRLSTGGQLREVALPRPRSMPRWITAGRDALYYTDPLAGRVGRLGYGGDAEEVSVQTCPQSACGLRLPDDITVAPDGSVWFSVDTLFASGLAPRDSYHDVCSLGPRLEPGECTQIDGVFEPSGHASGGPAAGSDGGMWFTNKYARILGRIPASGPRDIRRFRLPREADPEAITSGPDGALWFAEPSVDTVGRITTGGDVTRFALPRADSRPFSITPGPDGAVWFTERGAIGRITPDGRITEFPLGDAESVAYGIATGPDGAIWFSDQRTHRIGRLSLPASTPTPSPAPVEGPAPGPPAPATGTTGGRAAAVALLLRARVRPRRLRPGSRGRLTVALTLSRPALVAVRLQRPAGRRRTVLSRVVRRLAAGDHALHLRLPRRGLRRGRHQVVVEVSEGAALVSRTTLPVVVRPKR
jgi:virginiamycin B lyase